MANKYVYSFTEGEGHDKHLLGSKGANLCEMTQIGLNVPPGFVITTEACEAYLNHDNDALPEGLMDDVKNYIQQLEESTGKRFGDAENPLLVSVRSGSSVSMPGMMDTVLNLGLNQDTLQGLIKQTGDDRFGYDAYRRFVQLFGNVVFSIDDEHFDRHFESVKKRVQTHADVGLGVLELKEVSQRFLQVVEETTNTPFPEDVYEQLELAIKAVFRSWMGKRAVDYRREFNITPEQANGTAVNIVTMVFGNMGVDSATGVGFTRNPATGENHLYGEYLTNAQGEDVVAGIRTPKSVQNMEEEMPDLYAQLMELRSKLERHYREVQDFEFTIEKGKLYCLQTRNGKMNATALVRTSVEMVNEGLIDRDQAILRVNPDHLEQLLHPRLNPNMDITALAQGLSASPGAASGKCIFDADRAEALGRAGEKVILVREETKPEDIHGFFSSQGILTSRGGKTSHAAVVARSMGKACVAGAESIKVNSKQRRARIGDTVLHEGDIITIDGTTGLVYLGELPTVPPKFSEDLKTLLSWADHFANLKVMANADTPEDAKRALEYGAMGIGLCRTERMFNANDRLPIVVDMILAYTNKERQEAVDKLLPIQRADFKELLQVMSPHPVTVRLLDPPIHEFLPTEQQLIDEIKHLRQLKGSVQGVANLLTTVRHMKGVVGEEATALPSPFDEINEDSVNTVLKKKELMLRKVRELFEVNPMLGHRGVRLGITYPEIYAMQIRALLEAAAECTKEGIDVHPEIMVPQVCTHKELDCVRKQFEQLKTEVENRYEVSLTIKFGTMMEVVRACLRASEVAQSAEFFSFGTNDLTQAVFSFSREDAENKFLPLYKENQLLSNDPFEALDTEGVGRLMAMAVQWGRRARGGLSVGICGEQGANPESIRFCHHIDLDYVSCSAPRIPIARLSAAHAKFLEDKYQFSFEDDY